LVEGTNYTNGVKRLINDKIMKLNPNIEQVGFVEINNKPKLIMAGGEFCGNATRSAAYFYLKGKKGKIKIGICSGKKLVEAGIDAIGNAWSQIPHLFWKEYCYSS